MQLTDVRIQLLADSAVHLFLLSTSVLSLRDPHGSSLSLSPSSLPLLLYFISLITSSLMALPETSRGSVKSAHHIYLIAASSPECAVASLAGPSHFICCSK